MFFIMVVYGAIFQPRGSAKMGIARVRIVIVPIS